MNPTNPSFNADSSTSAWGAQVLQAALDAEEGVFCSPSPSSTPENAVLDDASKIFSDTQNSCGMELCDASLEQEDFEEVMADVHALLGSSVGTFIQAVIYGCGQRMDKEGRLVSLNDFELKGDFLVFRELPQQGTRSAVVLFHPRSRLYLKPNALQWRQLLRAEPCFGVLLYDPKTQPAV